MSENAEGPLFLCVEDFRIFKKKKLTVRHEQDELQQRRLWGCSQKIANRTTDVMCGYE